MNQKRPPLGKGLNALLGSMPRSSTLDATGGTAAASAGAETAADQLTRLGVDRLQRGRYQPRMDMRPESLQELADSIRAQGVVQPIVVRPIEMPGASEQTDLRYEIIAGERRWRAAQMAGLTEVPVVVRRVPDEAAIAMALILILVVRPVVAATCTRNLGLTRNERMFVGWMDPRGIVAAATAASVGASLVAAKVDGAADLLPAAFIIISVTVFVYGLTAVPVAKALGLREDQDATSVTAKQPD